MAEAPAACRRGDGGAWGWSVGGARPVSARRAPCQHRTCGQAARTSPHAPAPRTEEPVLQPFHAAQRFDPPWRTLLGVAGIRPATSGVVLDDDGFHARFGRLRVDTPWSNVAGSCRMGPFRWYRAIGPRLSLADRGATFGSSVDGGVCVTFHRPVAGLFGSRRVHPGLTVTVEDPDALHAAMTAQLAARS